MGRNRLPVRAAALALLLLALPLGAAGDAGPMAKARAALVRSDGIGAEVALKQALAQGVPVPQVSAALGQAYLLEGDYDQARRWLGERNFAADQRQYGLHMLALLETAQGNYAAAEQAFEDALAAGPAFAELWVDYGRMRYRAGQQHQALGAALEALKVGPKNPRAFEFRGQLVRDSQGLIAALPWFRAGLKYSPEDIGLLGEYAATLGEAGRAGDMLKVTRRMIELDSGNARAFYLQAVMAARAGHYALARRLLYRTGNSFDDVPAAMQLSGILELKADNPGLAVEIFAELARRQPDNYRVQRLFARALLDDGDASEVVARFGPLADRADADPYLLTIVGRAHEQLDERAKAAAYLDRAAAGAGAAVRPLPNGDEAELALFRWGNDPYRLEAMIPKIRDLLAQGKLAEASNIADRLSQHYPGSADVEMLSGDVALARGDARAALASYQQAAQIRRPYLLVERMVSAQRMLGEDDAALSLAEDYLGQHPQDGDAVLLVARLCAAKGRYVRARSLLLYARQLGALDNDPSNLALLAEAQLQAGDAPGALETAHQAYLAQRANARVAAIYARALQANGQQAEASAVAAIARKLGAM